MTRTDHSSRSGGAGVLLAVALTGLTFAGCGGGTGSGATSPKNAPVTTAIAKGAGGSDDVAKFKNLFSSLQGSEGLTYKAVYKTAGQGAAGGGTEITFAQKPPKYRLSSETGALIGTGASVAFCTLGEAPVCSTDNGPNPMAAMADLFRPAAVVQAMQAIEGALTSGASGLGISFTTEAFAGQDSKCMSFSGTKYCITKDGILAYMGSAQDGYELTSLSTDVADSEFDLPTASSTSTAPPTSTGSTQSTVASGNDPWTLTAGEHRGDNGSRFTLDCPAGGTARPVWGTETYSDDSSICTAAAHVGLITFDKGGTVEYQIAPGSDTYTGTSAHGVTTRDYGQYEGSFTFPAAPPGSGQFAISPESWSRHASEYRGENGTNVTIQCSANGTPEGVWGSVTYTDDSSICTAAVHAGLITLVKGGTVVIQISLGQDSYIGSTANGIATRDYGSFGGSFTFVNGAVIG